jgi:hypothetical protein
MYDSIGDLQGMLGNLLGVYGGALALASLVIGAIECFFGYRIFKIILGIVGFVAGAALGAMIAAATSDTEAVVWLAAVVGGLIGAGLAVGLYFIGIFLLGAVVGVLLGYALFAAMNSEPVPVVILILAVIAGIVAVAFQKLMIIGSTAFGGAWSVVSALASFIAPVNPLNPQTLARLNRGLLAGVVVGWLALGIAGAVVQYKAAEAKPAPSS